MKYAEAHITVEPVFDDRLEELRYTAQPFGFRPADLLMKKRADDTPERSAYDTFCTGRGVNVEQLTKRTIATVNALQKAGFKVWRYKVEAVLIDVRP